MIGVSLNRNTYIISRESILAVKKVVIRNFKCFKDLSIELNPGVNILVGDNDAGKSTILEAIHLALTGIYAGRSIRNALSVYLFNADAVREYLTSVDNQMIAPPTLSIELHFEGSLNPLFEGNDNSDKASNVEGFRFEAYFQEQYKEEYARMIKLSKVVSLPIEYYGVRWVSFARDSSVTVRSIPIKSVLIDSSNYRYQNGSDVYISRIVKELMDPEDILAITHAYRELVDGFAADETIQTINRRISEKSTIINGDISLTADQGTQNAWENSLTTQVAGIWI